MGSQSRIQTFTTRQNSLVLKNFFTIKKINSKEVDMSIQDPNIEPILQWHQEHQEQKEPSKGRALLRVVDGRLEVAHKADMSYLDHLLRFFGFGKYALEKVSHVIQETVKEKEPQQDLNTAIKFLNSKISEFSGRHRFRQVESIALSAIEQPPSDAEAVFSKIYDDAVWAANAKGEGTSGPGSTAALNRPYMSYLENFLQEKNIQSVVDLGCGDWEFSQHINWGDVEYTGYDVVESIIESDKERFGKEGRTFIQADILNTEIPEADLLICKDVLIHFPNNRVNELLEKTSHIKYRLFTNCLYFSSNEKLRPGEDADEVNAQLNTDIPLGKFRVLDLRSEPFNAKGEVVFEYETNSVKNTFLMTR